MNVDLLEFLKSGHFGSIHLGMLRQDVEKLIGEPQDLSIRDHPRVWKYGRLQLGEDENRLISIALYFNTPGPIWKTCSVVGWQPDSTISIEDFQQILAECGLRSSISPLVNDEDWVGFRMGSGVSTYFTRRAAASSLDSFQLLDWNYGASRAVERIKEVEQIVGRLDALGRLRRPKK